MKKCYTYIVTGLKKLSHDKDYFAVTTMVRLVTIIVYSLINSFDNYNTPSLLLFDTWYEGDWPAPLELTILLLRTRICTLITKSLYRNISL